MHLAPDLHLLWVAPLISLALIAIAGTLANLIGD